jgi:hypothetical protein
LGVLLALELDGLFPNAFNMGALYHLLEWYAHYQPCPCVATASIQYEFLGNNNCWKVLSMAEFIVTLHFVFK